MDIVGIKHENDYDKIERKGADGSEQKLGKYYLFCV
jgi:hypothetical protein